MAPEGSQGVTMLKIVVDTKLCSGHARCANVAPEIYRLNDDGYCISDGDDVPDGQEGMARRGARACPERAITLIDPASATQEQPKGMS